MLYTAAIFNLNDDEYVSNDTSVEKSKIYLKVLYYMTVINKIIKIISFSIES